MKIYSSIDEFKNIQRPIVTIGTFDGVHYGHRKIIDKLTEIAKKHNGETVLLTFSPHPRMVLFPDDHGLQLLNSLDEKKELLKNAGIQHLIIQPFTKKFSRISSMNFVRDVLVNQLNIHMLVIGYNHYFGRNREGSFENLQELSLMYGFGVEEVEAQLFNDISVSSTKIRQALNSSEVEVAASYLGYNYRLNGIVVSGNALGRTIDFPTANIKLLDSNKLIPSNGVYAVRVKFRGESYSGMMNIGIKPTLKNQKRTIEVHIINFNKKIYGAKIRVEFVKKVRDEIKFDNIYLLHQQLLSDRDKINQLLES